MERKASEFVIFGLKIGSQCRSVSIISPISVQIDEGKGDTHQGIHALYHRIIDEPVHETRSTLHVEENKSKKFASINKARLGEMLRRY